MKNKTPGKEPPFEEALERLETVVQEMESGDLALEEILKKYEEGNRLIQLCAAKLNEAEKRIEILMKEKNGSLSLNPLPLDEKAEEDPSDDTPGKKPRQKAGDSSAPSEPEEDLF